MVCPINRERLPCAVAPSYGAARGESTKRGGIKGTRGKCYTVQTLSEWWTRGRPFDNRNKILSGHSVGCEFSSQETRTSLKKDTRSKTKRCLALRLDRHQSSCTSSAGGPRRYQNRSACQQKRSHWRSLARRTSPEILRR